MPAPTKYPDWATDGTNVVEPPAGKVAAGWLPAEQPPAGWFNWWQNLVGQWSRWLNTRIGEIQAELDAYEGTVDSRAAFKDQANTFTQPQTITASGDALTATGHIISTAGSISAEGVGGNVHATADVTAGHDIDAGHNMHVDSDLYVDKGEYKYKTQATRIRTTFVPLFSGYGSAVFVPGSGTQSDTNACKLRFSAGVQEHAFPIRLPHGAVLTNCIVIVKVAVGTMNAVLNRRYNHQFQVQTGGTKALDQAEEGRGTWGIPGVGTLNIGCNLTIDNRADGGSEYVVTVISAANLDEIHAIRVTWTDPGPRNF